MALLVLNPFDFGLPPFFFVYCACYTLPIKVVSHGYDEVRVHHQHWTHALLGALDPCSMDVSPSNLAFDCTDLTEAVVPACDRTRLHCHSGHACGRCRSVRRNTSSLSGGTSVLSGRRCVESTHTHFHHSCSMLGTCRFSQVSWMNLLFAGESFVVEFTHNHAATSA